MVPGFNKINLIHLMYLIILSLCPLRLKLMSAVVIRHVYVAVNLVTVTRTWACWTCIH